MSAAIVRGIKSDIKTACGTKMANPLDKVTGPYDDEGRDAGVFEKTAAGHGGIRFRCFESISHGNSSCFAQHCGIKKAPESCKQGAIRSFCFYSAGNAVFSGSPAVLKTSATALIAAGTSPASVSVMERKRFLVTLEAFQTLEELSSR